MNSTKPVLGWIFIFILTFPFTLFSQDQATLNIALDHLDQKREALDLTKDDISNYRISDFYTSSHNGVTHIYLQQLHEGIEVRNALININVLAEGEILNMGNRFVADLKKRINATQPTIEPSAALQKVIEKFAAPAGHPIRIKEQKSEFHFVFENNGIALEPIPVQLKYELQQDKSVQLVWEVKLYQLDAQHWWNARVDAVSGEIISYNDIVIHCDFSHSGKSCEAAHPTHFPKNNSKKIIKNSTTTVLPNSYNVFPFPIESPSHGSRALLVDPADPTASPFGWHDTNGSTGAEFTITRGNNVHAYQDIFDTNGSIGDEPDGGALLEFDFPFNQSNNNPYTQVDGAVVNLFYWNNIIHDMWYQYGFDEASGNFQENNYGNGGLGEDYVRAEALDGSGTNNANFAPTVDGNRPRMQMYLWTGDQLPEIQMMVTAPASVAGGYPFVAGGFGGDLPAAPGIISQVVLVDDGTDTTSDACEDIINGDELDGKIALIDRGNCQFGTKMLRAQNAGAVAVIICNDEDTPSFEMGPGDDGAQVTIPGIMMSLADCNTLKMGLPDLTIEFVEPDFTIPTPGPSGFDGDYDNGIIVHEYTHGISNRLTGGPSQGGCLSEMEQAGEGWSDWFALVMQSSSSNTGEQGRGIGTYALGQPITGDGIRDFRYSRDMNIDPHTYADINSVAVPHGVGSVWAVMIWDLYWNMVDVYGFDDDLFHGEGGNNKTMQLVLDGLKLQPCDPSFVDARDAILAADIANYDGVNTCLIWETFARRGVGANAQAGGDEDFSVPEICNLNLKINKTAASESLASDILTYTIAINNDSPDDLTNLTITDVLPAGVELVQSSMSCSNFNLDGNTLTIELGDLTSGSSTICTYDVLVASAPFTVILFEDKIENGITNWNVESTVGDTEWVLSDDSYEGDFAWYAEDIASESDQRLTAVGTYEITGANPTLSFWHQYRTEQDWDGGVVELSTDGGTSWIDLGNFMIQNGYDGNVEINPASPISGQPAFHGTSNGYIQTLIYLNDFQGETVTFRFRLGCDGFVGADGWYVDNVLLYDDYHSITNSACVSSDLEENICSDVTTVIMENPNSTENIEDAFAVSIFPNPTDGKIFIQMKNLETSSATFQLMSLDGKLLKSKKVDYSSGTFSFDLAEFPAGVYTLQIQTDEGRLVRKVILQ